MSGTSSNLYLQCKRRVVHHLGEWRFSASEATIDRTTRQVEHIVHTTCLEYSGRIPEADFVDPITGIPDTYVDDVIRHLHAESERYRALLQRCNDTWAELIQQVIKPRVIRELSRFYHSGFITPFSVIVDDLTQLCAVKLLESLFVDYRFDSTLDGWVSMFVRLTVLNWLGKADTRHNVKARSLHAPLGTDSSMAFYEILPDPEYAYDKIVERLDYVRFFQEALPRLSPDQQEVVRRQLSNQTTEEIARAMNRSANAVYSLRSKAISAIRDFLTSESGRGYEPT